MIEALASDLGWPIFLAGGFLGGLFGGGKTTVTTSATVDVDVLVAPEIAVDVDVDVDTSPIAAALEGLGEEQAALFVAALAGQSQALEQQAAAITSFGEDVGGGARTLALAGLAAVAAFLFFGDGA